MAEAMEIINLYLNLATVLIAVYGIFYSLAVASEQSGAPGDIPAAVYTFGKVCWAMVILLAFAVGGAAQLTWLESLGSRIGLLDGAYAVVTGLLIWITATKVKFREPRR
ncbi:MAG: hypothetical protein RIE74_14460 [Pseudomonadales bacterium]